MTKKKSKKNFPLYSLNSKYLLIHKEGTTNSGFGLDNTNDLIDNGFGIYSSAGVREKIGPLKSEFYRIGFCLRGSLDVDCGNETFRQTKDSIHFTFPEQLFALKNKSDDVFSYYILFTQDFIEDLLSVVRIQYLYPFLDYGGVPFLVLSEIEARQTEQLFLEIDREIKNTHPDKSRAIKLLLSLILLNTNRSYVRQGLTTIYHNPQASSLVVRYKKLVAQHFIKTRSINEYALKLSVSVKHLSKVIKEETGKTPGYFITEMLIMEIKDLLKHSILNISEIAYQLDFTDPSHLSKFFKKGTNITPIQYRHEAF